MYFLAGMLCKPQRGIFISIIRLFKLSRGRIIDFLLLFLGFWDGGCDGNYEYCPKHIDYQPYQYSEQGSFNFLEAYWKVHLWIGLLL